MAPDVFADLRRFHDLFGVPAPSRPGFPSGDRVQLRTTLLCEEFGELMQALTRGDLVEVADGLADLIYVAIGTALELGIDLAPIWEEVHRSNMAKAPGGVVTRREDGKVLKPAGWTPPDVLSCILAQQGRKP